MSMLVQRRSQGRRHRRPEACRGRTFLRFACFCLVVCNLLAALKNSYFGIDADVGAASAKEEAEPNTSPPCVQSLTVSVSSMDLFQRLHRACLCQIAAIHHENS